MLDVASQAMVRDFAAASTMWFEKWHYHAMAVSQTSNEYFLYFNHNGFKAKKFDIRRGKGGIPGKAVNTHTFDGTQTGDDYRQVILTKDSKRIYVRGSVSVKCFGAECMTLLNELALHNMGPICLSQDEKSLFVIIQNNQVVQLKADDFSLLYKFTLGPQTEKVLDIMCY